jgi:hypothetical protein
MRSFFNGENYFMPKELGGGGAGNIWGKGYDAGSVAHVKYCDFIEINNNLL